MRRHKFNVLVGPILDKFISELEGYYHVYISDELLKVYLLDKIYEAYEEYTGAYQQDVVYKGSIRMFETYLEHGCSAGRNGHHVSQKLCSYFSMESFKF